MENEKTDPVFTTSEAAIVKNILQELNHLAQSTAEGVEPQDEDSQIPFDFPGGLNIKPTALPRARVGGLCGAYREFQTEGKGCKLPQGHEGNHCGDSLNLGQLRDFPHIKKALLLLIGSSNLISSAEYERDVSFFPVVLLRDIDQFFSTLDETDLKQFVDGEQNETQRVLRHSVEGRIAHFFLDKMIEQ